MLFQADALAKTYAPLVAKAAPPSNEPQTESLLGYASNWFSIDLTTLKTDGRSVLGYLGEEALWTTLAEIGIEAVELKGLKSPDPQVKFQIDLQFGTEDEYTRLLHAASQKGIHFIGKTLGQATGRGADFALGLKNVGAYPELYAMVEIAPEDWKELPEVKERAISANVPWLTVQKLHKMGYVPTDFDPYVQQSAWNVTGPILGADHVTRRWIYLRDARGFPRLNWLNPSFGALRLAAGDSLYSMLRLGQSILQLENLPLNTQETLSLTIRKLKGFSAALSQAGIESMTGPTDVTLDHLTPIAALHAVIAEDAEALRLIYNLLLSYEIQPKRLVHALEPFGRLPNDWAEFINSPERIYSYYNTEEMGQTLRKRFLDEDRAKIKGEERSWRCLSNLSDVSFKDVEKKRDAVFALQMTLTKFFALQPGIFSLSPQDLLGAFQTDTKVDLLGGNVDCLYSCAPNQLLNPTSFASQLKKILRVRKDLSLEKARLTGVVAAENKGLLLLQFSLPQSGKCALLTVNFSRKAVTETLESPEYAHATAIDPIAGLAENKAFASSFFSLKLDPLSTKLILFEPKKTKK